MSLASLSCGCFLDLQGVLDLHPSNKPCSYLQVPYEENIANHARSHLSDDLSPGIYVIMRLASRVPEERTCLRCKSQCVIWASDFVSLCLICEMLIIIVSTSSFFFSLKKKKSYNMSLREKLLRVCSAASIFCACFLSQMNGQEDFCYLIPN